MIDIETGTGREWKTWQELRPTLNVDEAEVSRLTDDIIHATRAHKLVELRESCGMTQVRLAELAGLDQPRVSRIERGNLSRIEIATLQAYIAALGGQLELLMHVGDSIYRLPLSESWHAGQQAGSTPGTASKAARAKPAERAMKQPPTRPAKASTKVAASTSGTQRLSTGATGKPAPKTSATPRQKPAIAPVKDSRTPARETTRVTRPAPKQGRIKPA